MSSSRTALIQLQQRLDDTFLELLAKVDPLTNEQQNARPAEDKWSVNQVLSHLFQSEQGTLKYITYKVKTRDNIRPSTWKSALRILSLKVAFWLPVRYKAPRVTATVPDTLDYQELKKEWLLVRKGYQELSQSFPEELFGQNIFNHPILGRLHILHAYTFLIEHMHHHHKQVDALIKWVRER